MQPDPEAFKVLRPPSRGDIDAEVAKFLEAARKVTGSTTEPKNHHIVPRWYLDQWAVGGKLQVTETGTNHSTAKAPRRVGAELHFYRIDTPTIDPEELPPPFMEMVYGVMEDRGKHVVEALAHGGVDALGDGDAVHLAQFLGLTVTRGRSFRVTMRLIANKAMLHMFGGMNDTAIRRRLRANGMDHGDEAVANIRDSLDRWERGEFVMAPQKAALIGHAAEIGVNIGLGFLARRWRVYVSTLPLVTCDELVVCIAGPRHPRSRQGAQATAGVVVYPLDPHHLLAMFHPELDLDEAALWPHLLPSESAELNLEIVAASYRWAFERCGGAQVRLAAVPPRPPSVQSESIAVGGPDGHRDVFHSVQGSRWWGCPSPPPWPVERWWAGRHRHRA